MLKYVAIIQVIHRETLLMLHAGPSHRNYMSPVCEDSDSAKEWLEEYIKEYPDTRYIVTSGIIAFDTEQSENAEHMLESLMRVF